MAGIAIGDLGLFLLQVKRGQRSYQEGGDDLLQNAILTDAVLAFLCLISDCDDLLSEFPEHADFRFRSNLSVEKCHRLLHDLIVDCYVHVDGTDMDKVLDG